MKAQQQLPQYKSHKMVGAVKIEAIEIHADKSATITPENSQFSPFKTQAGWAERYTGSDADKGYFVQYADGFASWSPTQAFEDGYALATDV